jgi:hypothetical protein
MITAALLLGVPASAQVNLDKIGRQPTRVAPARPTAAEVENAAWKVCANARTVEPCNAYLRDYPGGSYRRVAAIRISDLNGGPGAATPAEVAPVAAAPATAVVAAAPVAVVVSKMPIKTDRNAERVAWAACDAGTTTAPCDIYLARYPQGRRVPDARLWIEKRNVAGAETAVFTKCQAGKTAAVCEDFIKRYPKSPLVGAAQTQIGFITARAARRGDQ